MRSRGLVVALALLLAVGATAAVFLYVHQVKQDAVNGVNNVTVLVSKEDIQAGTALNPLIEQNNFGEQQIPSTAEVDGAVTDVSQLKNHTVTDAILAGEQIPISRLSGGALPGGKIGITPGHVSVSVRMDPNAGGAGTIQVGDNVTVYATFSDASILTGPLAKTLKKVGSPTGGPTQFNIGDFTVTLVPNVRVLAVNNPNTVTTAGTTSTTTTGSTSSSAAQNNPITVSLDLTPQDAQNVVFAQKEGEVYLGLLAPGDQGTQLPGVSLPLQLLLGKKGA